MAIGGEEGSASPETEVRKILGTAADYLAYRTASRFEPGSPEDDRMRETGALLQQRLTRFFLAQYSPHPFIAEQQSRNLVKGHLGDFWERYRHLVIEPLGRQGLSIGSAPEDSGLAMVLGLRNGVRGMIATSMMALDSGWELEWPTPQEDARRGIDLRIARDELRVPLQVKCLNGMKFIVNKERVGDLVWVGIPGDSKNWFRDFELGIPNTSHSAEFNNWIMEAVARFRGGRR